MWQLLMLNGVSSSFAAATTIMIRLTTLWFAVLVGIIALPRFTTKHTKKASSE